MGYPDWLALTIPHDPAHREDAALAERVR
jgi:hypothetical protein